jgi:hypothetical protein
VFHKRTYRHRPVGSIFDELRELTTDVILVYDNIVADPDYAKALFKAITPLRKPWVSQAGLISQTILNCSISLRGPVAMACLSALKLSTRRTSVPSVSRSIEQTGTAAELMRFVDTASG